MQSDLPNQTRDQTLLSLACKHLNNNFNSLEEIETVNISGMSNVTYIISSKKEPSNKVVIRFFESKAADFATEASIFRQMGKRGWGPKEIESTDVYRVEEYIDGRPLTMFELRNPFIAKTAMEMICETNYDEKLNKLIKQLKTPNHNFSQDFVSDSDNGWFNRYMRDVRPQLLQADFTNFPRALEIFNVFESIVRDKDQFIKEYEGLYPSNENVLFSHNDIQENNIMVWNQDKTQLTLIDFEYSSLNFRGYDIASYINETAIDYAHPVVPKFKLYEEFFDSIIEEKEIDLYLGYYLKKYHQIMSQKIEEYEYKGQLDKLLEKELPILRDEVLRCILLQHLIWSFWTLIMMPIEDLKKCENFYLEYGYQRLQMYIKYKDQFLGLASKQ